MKSSNKSLHFPAESRAPPRNVQMSAQPLGKKGLGTGRSSFSCPSAALTSPVLDLATNEEHSSAQVQGDEDPHQRWDGTVIGDASSPVALLREVEGDAASKGSLLRCTLRASSVKVNARASSPLRLVPLQMRWSARGCRRSCFTFYETALGHLGLLITFNVPQLRRGVRRVVLSCPTHP